MRRVAYLLVLLLLMSLPLYAQTPQNVTVDFQTPATAFPHFWEQSFGSGRAILSLREGYRNDMREMKKTTDFRYVRFHAILHDEVGVYDEDESGRPAYNFTYVGQIYDGLLGIGVRPIVEISFMPKKLAMRQDLHPFWYKQNVAPPKNYGKWDELMRQFAEFLVARYGIEEVSQWYFEVWNEPNIDFWSGDPKLETYLELYDHTARVLKSVNPRLRVGGPATSSAHWVTEFLAHTAKENVPVDFVSSHGYPDDTVEDLFGNHDYVPVEQRTCKAIDKVRKQIEASAKPGLPLFWTEWSVAGYGERRAGDTSYSATAIAQNLHDCDGKVQIMSYWTFSDVFEENGPPREPFYGGFGLIAPGGIKKTGYYTFALLHKLGTQRLANTAENVLVTRREDGTNVVAVWNVVPPDQAGAPIQVELTFAGAKADAKLEISRIDAQHGNTLAAYAAMGSPRYPTVEQAKELNKESALPAPEKASLKDGKLSLTLPVNGFALLEFAK